MRKEPLVHQRDSEVLEWISLAWEQAHGFDSIPTIERVYDRSPSGAYMCCWPECTFKRKDPAEMWRHVHTHDGRNDLPPDDFDYGAWL